MNNDQKPGYRITAERVSVTTIRSRSETLYCENCRRALSAEEICSLASDLENRDAIAIKVASAAAENEKEK